MKNTIASLILLLASLQLIAQVNFGVKAGMHSIDLANESIILPGQDEEFTVNIKDSEYGYQFGLFSQITLGKLFLEPSFMFHTSSVNYTIDEIGEQGVINTIKNEKFKNFDIPIMVGYSFGAIQAFGGPVAHLNIETASDLIDIPGYEARFDNANYGFQIGLGLDFWKLRFEAKYEGNLSKYGEHIHIGDQNFSFDKRPSRIIANVGIRF